MRSRRIKPVKRRRSSFIRPRPIRPLGSPAFAALLGPSIFLGMSGLLSAEIFDIATLISPFVALIFAVCTGLANFLGTRRFGRKTLPLIVAASGFIAGTATVALFNRLVHTVIDPLHYWTAGTTCLAGAAGAVVFILLGMTVWRIRRPRTLLET